MHSPLQIDVALLTPRRARSVALLVLVGALLLGGCATTAPRVRPGASGEVIHVVLCWLKDPGNEAQQRELIRVSHTFKDLPGVLEISTGTALPRPRPVVDSSFDVAILIRFADADALRSYLEHPRHRQAVEQTLKPLVARILVYDVRLETP